MFSRCQVVYIYTDLVYSINSLFSFHVFTFREFGRGATALLHAVQHECLGDFVPWWIWWNEGRCDLSKHLAAPKKPTASWALKNWWGWKTILFLWGFSLLSGAILALRTLVKPNEQWKTNRLSSVYRGWTTTQLYYRIVSWTNEKDPGTLTNQVNKISWHVDMFLVTLIRWCRGIWWRCSRKGGEQKQVR